MRQIVVLHPIPRHKSGPATAPTVVIDPGDDLLPPDGLDWSGGWVLQSIIYDEIYAQMVAIWLRCAFPRGSSNG